MICAKHGYKHRSDDPCPNARVNVPFLFATGCSGINSCAEAWLPLGWVEAFCAEVEPFPAAVLAHRYGSGRPETMPDPLLASNAKDRALRKSARKTIQRIPPHVPGAPPNLGDFTRPDFVARAKQVLAGRHLDVFCAGTPCQGYSVAGLRGSMTDARSNLMFCFVEAYHGLGADFAVWENVPGCLNTPDNAFGHLLGGLARTSVPYRPAMSLMPRLNSMGLYAADTGVSSDRSKAEIEATLRRYGADQFMAGWKDGQAVVQFRIKNRMVRFVLPLPSTDEFKVEVKWKREREAAPETVQKNWEQACRQRWRALALAIKAKLEAVACGITTFEEEFFCHLIVPGSHGKTVGEMMLPKYEEACASGKPMALDWGGK